MFKDRTEAGRILARKLLDKEVKADIVAAIPRGGIPVGAEISRKLQIPMVPIVIKKVPTHGEPELASGAVGPGGIFVGKKSGDVQNLVYERMKKYGSCPSVSGKNVILTDDGVATGATIQAGILFLRKKKAGKIIVAVPVVSEEVFQGLFKFADDVVAVLTPSGFHAIGEFYGNFEQLTDDEVIQLLNRQ